jgi:hypothetical protein
MRYFITLLIFILVEVLYIFAKVNLVIYIKSDRYEPDVNHSVLFDLDLQYQA